MVLENNISAVSKAEQIRALLATVANAANLRYAVFVDASTSQQASVSIVVTGFPGVFTAADKSNFLNSLGDTIVAKIADGTLITDTNTVIRAKVNADIPRLKTDLQQLITDLTAIQNG